MTCVRRASHWSAMTAPPRDSARCRRCIICAGRWPQHRPDRGGPGRCAGRARCDRAGRSDRPAAVALADWVDQGGLLIRFAGPRMAGSEWLRDEPLFAVMLREGGRDIGGALSLGAPRPLAPLPADGPLPAGRSDRCDRARQLWPEPRPIWRKACWRSWAMARRWSRARPFGQGTAGAVSPRPMPNGRTRHLGPVRPDAQTAGADRARRHPNSPDTAPGG